MRLNATCDSLRNQYPRGSARGAWPGRAPPRCFESRPYSHAEGTACPTKVGYIWVVQSVLLPRYPTMDAKNLLQRMCSRQGLSLSRGSHLLPLVERALHSPESVRNRILSMVANSLARKVNGEEMGHETGTTQEDLDEEVLISVARVMHTWAPSARVHELEELLPDLFPEGFDPKSLD